LACCRRSGRAWVLFSRDVDIVREEIIVWEEISRLRLTPNAHIPASNVRVDSTKGYTFLNPGEVGPARVTAFLLTAGIEFREISPMPEVAI
jgi:hypothetical protein